MGQLALQIRMIAARILAAAGGPPGPWGGKPNAAPP